MSKKQGLTLDEQHKIKGLAALGKTHHAIAIETGRDPKTIKKYVENPQASAEIYAIKQNLITSFEDMAHRMLDSITDTDINKLSAYQRVISSGVAVDKAHLLRSESLNKERPLIIINNASVNPWGSRIEGKQPIEIEKSGNE